MATVKKRKEKKSVYEGNVYIQATFNNTIVTVTDMKGNALSWASSGGTLHLAEDGGIHPEELTTFALPGSRWQPLCRCRRGLTRMATRALATLSPTQAALVRKSM